MKDIFKKIKKGQMIGVYRFEMNAFVAGEYMGMTREGYILLNSFNPHGKNDGVKLILASTVKRITLESTYLDMLKRKALFRKECTNVIRLNKSSPIKNLLDTIIKERIEVGINIKGEESKEGYITAIEGRWIYFDMINENMEIEGGEAVKVNNIEKIEIGRYAVSDIEVIDKRNKMKDVSLSDYVKTYKGYIIAKDREHILLCERQTFNEDSKFSIVRKDEIEEEAINITNTKTEIARLDELFKDIEEMKMREVLRKCMENALKVFIDSEDIPSIKKGKIYKVWKNKVRVMEADDNDNFFQYSDVSVSKIQILYIGNYRIL